MPDGGELTIEVCGERLLLHPEKAVSWPARRTLLIADPHFGKDDVFRRSGIALPRGPAIEDLQRLSGLIAGGIDRLVVLGDFLHAATREGDSFPRAFATWRGRHAQLAVEVVAGNHDRHERQDKWAGFLEWRAGPCLEAPFVWSHDPGMHAEGYGLCGHVHPVMALSGAGSRRGARVPVFHRRPRWMVLPSFGSFTGGALIVREPEDRLYLAGPERVVQLGG